MKTKTKNRIQAIAILALGLFLGWLIFGVSGTTENEHNHQELAGETIWTCSMHPQIQQSESGACPLCGMDLIPLEEDQGGDPTVFVMSENALRLANVSTMIVGTDNAERTIRLNGKVQVDERNSYSQTTHIQGRIEQLRINFTGEKVSRGQTLAQIYSPEMVTAQQELLQAYVIRNSQPELFEAAKTKLRNWKISNAQIDQIIANQKPLDRFTIQADVNGVVTKKNVELGDYVERGMSLYEIADLSKLWVLFDVYESQMNWVNEGSKITFTVNSLPGETFEGTISFIDPLMNAQTRVATARVEVNNKDGKLKPEMFVSGTVQAASRQTVESEMILPKSAILWTGKRAIVYVKEGNGFALREVNLGSALGENYIVKSGLSEGEEVVVNGAFTIDAAVQLSGRPSMMSPQGGRVNTEHNHGDSDLEKVPNISEKVKLTNDAKIALQPLFKNYFSLKEHLAEDNFENALISGKNLKDALGKVNMKYFEGKSNDVWMAFDKQMKTALESANDQKKIEGFRSQFQTISDVLIQFIEQTGPYDDVIYVQHCPMANNNQGADWLSLSKEIKNPYFGSVMLRCGEVTDSIQ
ncbi:efflux RND transporter periplasmic adaptor subunit [Paucihalobacter ruber]|uniref:Efflux RND transporter periplasmic adaptor subunit n=1 Tax=Paucihalobacter ruber TaxID=2567861 RepID=A0A506PPK5_9FLAO|nr:efflux RND transporter periplasmic adaptor subunit [Paucihalobacter ruber]TPV35641.1 efflux RND transporter periplasmic adaptor subunit [Paucihalobacter ruber]